MKKKTVVPKRIAFMLAGLIIIVGIYLFSYQSYAQGLKAIEYKKGAQPSLDINGSFTDKVMVDNFPERIVDKTDACYTYEEMLSDMDKLKTRYGRLITLNCLGISSDGREIKEMIIGNYASENHIIIQASMHAREYINTLIAMCQTEEFLAGFTSLSYEGVSYKALIKDVCFHIIPMINPDGVSISQMGPEAIRNKEIREGLYLIYEKDASYPEAAEGMARYWQRFKANALGVDLNRNFNSGWFNFVGRSHPSSALYKGQSAASEAETQALLKIVEQKNVVCCVAYHSMGNIIYWDYGSSGSIYEEDKLLADALSRITGYNLHSTISSKQDAAGASDYFVLELGIPAVTIENGAGDVPVDMEEFGQIMKANEDVLPALATLYGK